jgi:hypothetical protein
MRSEGLTAENMSVVIYDVVPCSAVKWLHTLLMKVGNHLQNYTASQPKTSQSTNLEKSLPSNQICELFQGDRDNVAALSKH